MYLFSLICVLHYILVYIYISLTFLRAFAVSHNNHFTWFSHIAPISHGTCEKISQLFSQDGQSILVTCISHAFQMVFHMITHIISHLC